MVQPDQKPTELVDRLGRPLRDLRVSVTDKCNFRCTYCMPRDKTDTRAFLPRSEILDFEEIVRLVKSFAARGVRKVRVTGGEPLLRRQISSLISLLKPLGVEVALTTNGVLLKEVARELKDAGLDRITVSLDALDPDVFQKVCDAPSYGPEDVLEGIEAAHAAGFETVKVNCAVRRGFNDDQVVPIARHFAGTPVVVRFIEFMDVGTRNDWDPREVFSATELRAKLAEVDELVPLESQYRGEVAQRYRYRNGAGEVGIIASVSRPFCGDCTRARLSADGSLYTCLFAHTGFDLRQLVRSGASDEQLDEALVRWWSARVDRYSERRAIDGPRSSGDEKHLPVVSKKVEMSFIGG
jgi:cyclic pyranopterin phosphate synthase